MNDTENRMEVSVRLELDEDGYIGRECPQEDCLGYFKIKPGTGFSHPAPLHCPYCGHEGDQDAFFTQEQVAYAQSVAFREIADSIFRDFKTLEFDHRPRGGFGIGVSMKVVRSDPYPIHYYREKQLETKILCEECTLDFTIYGVFGWCPDCGTHNSLQILSKNLELAKRELALAATVDNELSEHLVGDALENVVAAFDGFGRELCARRQVDVRFQNIEGARKRVRESFGFDFADGLTPEDWAILFRVFHKRHLLAHKMGVMDDGYVRKAGDRDAVVGRKVRIDPDEVSKSAALVATIGTRLFKEILA